MGVFLGLFLHRCYTNIGLTPVDPQQQIDIEKSLLLLVLVVVGEGLLFPPADFAVRFDPALLGAGGRGAAFAGFLKCNSLEHLYHLDDFVVAIFLLLVHFPLLQQFVPQQVYYDLFLQIRPLPQETPRLALRSLDALADEVPAPAKRVSVAACPDALGGVHAVLRGCGGGELGGEGAGEGSWEVVGGTDVLDDHVLGLLGSPVEVELLRPELETAADSLVGDGEFLSEVAVREEFVGDLHFRLDRDFLLDQLVQVRQIDLAPREVHAAAADGLHHAGALFYYRLKHAPPALTQPTPPPPAWPQ